MRTGAGDGLPGPTDAWLTLAGLARETAKVRLGTLVSAATFRLPGPLAVGIAQIDEMSGGRIELGIGTGWFESEHRRFGIPFPSMKERFERLEEQLAIITGLWETPVDERFSFDGQHYALAKAPTIPKPVQRPRPPIIIGGFGANVTPRLAARYAQEFNVPYASMDTFTLQRDRVARACEAVDRDPATMTWSATFIVCCGEDERTIERRAARIGMPVEDLRSGALAGTPDEVRVTLDRFAGAGLDRAYLQLLDLQDLEHLALLAETLLELPGDGAI
jgi:F420-dependent oxidoreductase-like protein